MIKRREFIAGLGGTVAWPVAAWAQQTGERVRRIGVLMLIDENDRGAKTRLSAFTQALAELGWTEGRNLLMYIRLALVDVGRVQALAKELVGLQPEVILVNSTPGTAALQRETGTIPIVFVNVGDPVGSGFVAAFNEPGGNITGFGFLEASIGGKLLELLSEIAPGLKRAAILFNPDTAPVSAYMPSFEAGARSLKIEPIVATVRSDAEIEATITSLRREPGGGLVVMPDVFMFNHRVPIISAAARNKVPTVYWQSVFAKDGGLLSYGVDPVDNFRRAGRYVDRILRGAKPGDLPVQFPTKYEMAVNLKTVKALGVTIPPNLLAVAHEVIE